MDNTTAMLNTVIEALSDQLPFEGMARILWIDERAALTTLITIAETPRQPWVAASEDVQTWLLRGDARRSRLRLPAYMLQIEEEIPEGEKALRDRNWERIAGLVDSGVPGRIFAARAMGALVASHARATGTQRKTLYRLLYRYWTSGRFATHCCLTMRTSGRRVSLACFRPEGVQGDLRSDWRRAESGAERSLATTTRAS